MAENNAGLHPQWTKGERDNNIVPMEPEVEGRGAHRALYANRYRLKAPHIHGQGGSRAVHTRVW